MRSPSWLLLVLHLGDYAPAAVRVGVLLRVLDRSSFTLL